MKGRPMSEDAATQEIVDRVRRIETRVTKMGHAMGVDVGGGKPRWNRQLQRVMMPSPNCSVSECLTVIPDELRDTEVDLYVGPDYVCTVFVDP